VRQTGLIPGKEFEDLADLFFGVEARSWEMGNARFGAFSKRTRHADLAVRVRISISVFVASSATAELQFDWAVNFLLYGCQLRGLVRAI